MTTGKENESLPRRTGLCTIADWLVQWIIANPDEPLWPMSYSSLREFAEEEGLI